MIRYIRNDSRVYGFSLCKHCGAAGGCDFEGCKTLTCLWCGTPQCSSNGLGNGLCTICHHGFLPGWSGSHAGQSCKYKGCEEPAVGVFPRKGRCCAEHGARNLKPGYLEGRLAARERLWHAVEVSR